VLDAGAMADWVMWHGQYERADSSLARRLVVVRRRIGHALASLQPGQPLHILSLCAGDGRDLLPELAGSGRRYDRATLVEWNATLAARATQGAEELGLDHVVVIAGDAGRSATFADLLPVDLLLLCGIFGNISDDDIRATVAATRAMLTAGGIVVWTRGKSDRDIRPVVRGWFAEEGLEELSFDGDPEPFGIGVSRLAAPAAPTPALPERLFTFTR
jgi:Putative methyltransferase